MRPIIVLFRQDLRLADNPALTHACQQGIPIIPLYILDDLNPGAWKAGSASRWWLHFSLTSLDDNLKALGSQLFLKKGDTFEILKNLIGATNASAVYWNRGYEPFALKLEKKISELFPHSQSFKGGLLFELWEIWPKQKSPFKIYAQFWKKCLENAESIEDPLPPPDKFQTFTIPSERLASWQLLPSPNWDEEISTYWELGEKAALAKLTLLSKNLYKYEQARDFPAFEDTSRLSPHLHFGEISPRQVFAALKDKPSSEKFIKELIWREFSYYQLYHYPKLPEQPIKPEFNRFPWKNDSILLKKWQKGLTGYPIVDAGMRQLWRIGWMHNRVRMIVASFLIKDLFIPWQEGEKWFWDTLVDADLANNSASWQWIAGCGLDPFPFFRIFNPMLQGAKFDPDGLYIKKWIPELANVPKEFIHEPWKAGALKGDYPNPIVDHKEARIKALAAFRKIKYEDE